MLRTAPLTVLTALSLVAAGRAATNFTEVANLVSLFRRPLDAFGLNLAREIEIPTAQGPLRGRRPVYGGDGGVFLGIPYAEAERWASPTPASSWSDVRDALEPGPACPQPHAHVETSEDCLFLNVFTPKLPSGDAKEGLPVMLFIHGGSFVYGDGMSEAFGISIYDGQAMAELGNVVVVTINYRLGALGYLALDSLRYLSDGGGTGNYGLQDQREAMRWVQSNIAAFGGDKDQVTIFGESAGSMSVMFHVTSPLSAGLFKGAIMESGDEIARTWKQATEEGRVFAKSLGCDNLGRQSQVACLRSKTVTEVQNAKSVEIPVAHNADVTLRFAPVVDGVELKELPRQLYAEGKVNPVDMIVGTNLNEAALFVCQKVPPTAPASAYKKEILKFFGADVADRLIDLYPLSDYKLVRDAVIDVGTDFFFTCPSRHIARGVAKAGKGANQVYRYQLRHSPDVLVLSAPFYGGGWPTSYCLGVGHALDLVFVFHNLQPLLFPAEKRLADRMTAYWTNFARSGNPNGPERDSPGVWPQYPAADQTLALDLDDYAVTSLRNKKCDVIDQIQNEEYEAGRTLPTVRDFINHRWMADDKE